MLADPVLPALARPPRGAGVRGTSSGLAWEQARAPTKSAAAESPQRARTKLPLFIGRAAYRSFAGRCGARARSSASDAAPQTPRSTPPRCPPQGDAPARRRDETFRAPEVSASERPVGDLRRRPGEPPRPLPSVREEREHPQRAARAPPQRGEGSGHQPRVCRDDPAPELRVLGHGPARVLLREPG